MGKAKRPAKAAKPAARRRRLLAITYADGQLGTAHSVGFNDRLRDTFGTASLDFAQWCLASLLATHRPGMAPDMLASKTNATLAAVNAVRPRDELQAMLAAQMAATHDLAMEAVGNARRQGSDGEALAATRLANDLLQTFTRQVDALATLRSHVR